MIKNDDSRVHRILSVSIGAVTSTRCTKSKVADRSLKDVCCFVNYTCYHHRELQDEEEVELE